MAVDRVNTLYGQDSRGSQNSFLHSRDLSTISNITLFTSTTLHSQPTEPLLHTTTLQSINYDDLHQLDSMPRNRNETIRRLPCEAPLMIDDNPLNEAEKRNYRARNCRRPLERWEWLKLGLQACLSAWAIYNTVRYLITFTNFDDSTNQAFCLALGTSTGISFLLTLFSFLLAARNRNGLVRGMVTPSYLSYLRKTMDYISSFCLLGPAVVNFALIFIWMNSVDPHFNFENRCHLDVDVVWSVSNLLCNTKSPRWAIWLVLSALRLFLTLIISIGYHSISSSYHRPRRQRAIRGSRAQTSELSTPEVPVPSSFNLPHRELSMLDQFSDSTLCGTPRGESSPHNQIRLARSHSSSLSQDISPTKTILGRSTIAGSENGHDSSEFVDRFQFGVSQIDRETDTTLDVAHSDSPSPDNKNDIPNRGLPPSYEEDLDDFDDILVDHSHNNGNNMFNLPPVFPALGYNEFGIPYPPDQNIRVLNGYIRRMPTIESMGSGEVGSSIGASSNRAGESIFTSSRPPTRNTLLSRHSTDHDALNSEPPSRANSLSARAELLVGLSSGPSSISEHGELLGRTSPVARLSTPITYVDYGLNDTYSSATSRSRSTSSYHTATSDSFYPPGLTLDRSLSPVLGQRDIISNSDQQPP